MESLAGDLRQMVRTPLQDRHVSALHRHGREITIKAGEMVAEIGDPMDQFLYLVDGEFEVIDPQMRKPFLPHALGPGQFVGDIAFLNGGSYSMPFRAAKDTTILTVPRADVLALMSKIP